MSTPVLLKIRDLHVCFDGAHGEVSAASHDIHEREVVGTSANRAAAERERICRDGPSSYGPRHGARWSFAANVLDYKRESWDALRVST